MSMESSALSKQRIIAELTRSPHGKLKEYLEVGVPATTMEPEFMAHLVAWDAQKGQVRDAHVALPIVMLHTGPTTVAPGILTMELHPDFVENALAHLAKLNPRELLRAYRFALEIKLPGRRRKLEAVIRRYLRNIESIHWARIAVQHKAVLKELYALTHTKPSAMMDEVVLKGHNPPGTVFAAVAQLKNMSAVEAAGTILEWKIPFLIALGALGKKAKEPDLVMALIKRMTPTELITNTKMLEKLGVKTNPILRAAYEQGIVQAAASTKNVLKTTRAVEAIQDEGLKEKLRGVQEKQLGKVAVEGNWLILADKSGSMQNAIVASRHIAATLSQMVKGKVWLTFFDVEPITVEVPPGTSLDILKMGTEHIIAGGGTSIGCGLNRMLVSNLEIDGIVIVSDGCENTPPRFWDVYDKYSKRFDKEVPVYLYLLEGTDYPHHREEFLRNRDIQVFDIRHTTDYYSLPNLVATMRTNRYSLTDEIMATKLLTLNDVFKSERKEANVNA